MNTTTTMAVVRKMGWDSLLHTPITGGQHGNAYYWVFLPSNPA